MERLLSMKKGRKLADSSNEFLSRLVRDPYDMTCVEEFEALQSAATRYESFGQTAWEARDLQPGGEKESFLMLPANKSSYRSPLVRFDVEATFQDDDTAIDTGTFSIFITRDNVNKGFSYVLPDACKLFLTSVQSWGPDSDTSITKSFALKVVNIQPEGRVISVKVVATALLVTSDIFMQRFVVLPALASLLRMLLDKQKEDKLLLNKSSYNLTMPTFKKCTLVELLTWIPEQLLTERTPLVARALGFQTNLDPTKKLPELETFIAWTYWCNLYFMKRGTGLVQIGFKQRRATLDVSTVVSEIQKTATSYFLKLKTLGLNFKMPGHAQAPMISESTEDDVIEVASGRTNPDTSTLSGYLANMDAVPPDNLDTWAGLRHEF